MGILDAIKEHGAAIKKKFNDIFDKNYLDELARDTGFIKRSTSKIQGQDFVQLMALEMAHEPKRSTC